MFFRERGACIHAFDQLNPSSVLPTAAGRTFAVENAAVFPISGAPEPRAPEAPVPAPIKWLNDALDEVLSLLPQYNSALANAISDAHDRTVTALRILKSTDVTHTVTLATPESSDNPDDWDDIAMAGLQHIVNTVDIVSVGADLGTIGIDQVHATIVLGGQQIDIVAIHGSSHEACVQHLHSMRFRNQRRHLLLVSRDPDNRNWYPKYASFLDQEAPKIDSDREFTDPMRASFHIGYQNLLSIFEQATSTNQIVEAINAELSN